MDDLPSAILHLLNLVNLDQGNVHDEMDEDEDDDSDERIYHNIPHLFAGSLGIHLLTQTVKQISIMRLQNNIKLHEESSF